MRIVFMGTPDFAARILKDVAAWDRGEVVGVYAQPDRPAGRGKKLRAPAVKLLAQELGIPVYQPLNFKADEDVAVLASLKPDVLVVAAYGLLLPQRVLDIPVMGAYNVHASLLPQYRGAAPIQRAIMNGDIQSGVTIMRMEAGLDTGPILLQQAVAIEPDDTSGTMFEVLAEYGAKVMVGALGMLIEQRAAFIPQNDAKATHAAKITRDEEYVDWGLPATKIHNIIRGLTPAPGARSFLMYDGMDPVAVHLEPGAVAQADQALELVSSTPGTVVGYDGKSMLVACGKGLYRLGRVRPAGKGFMPVADFVNGRLNKVPPHEGARYPLNAMFKKAGAE